MEFKVGDKVRCVDNVNTDYLIIGKLYTISEITQDDGDIFLNLLEEPAIGEWWSERFELFKRGKRKKFYK